ncbi:MAG: S8 family serine peptidase [Bacteroidales bacterium]|nr:S8 family serine peptidase [Bacteroidales bacterium]
MTRTLKFAVLAFVVALISGCSAKDSALTPDIPATANIPNVGEVKTGSIIVKMKEEIAQTKSVADALYELDIYSIEKLFPTDPRFEERHKKAGLHLWYHISFNPQTSLTKAFQDLSTMEGVEKIEYMPVIVPTQALTNPFNDPYFDYQWHYHNTAPKDGYVAGADINLLKAWNLETGDESVIVAVTDAGVDYKHEDLAGAMWVNELELNGTQGIDDDENGSIDDSHGYNFAVAADGSTMQGAIKPEDHGTHVAGTVAAVNNNGKFGAGIAGGNGVKKGVRLMSCQTISGDSPSYIQRAFVYAADNGAVISQNSWSLLGASSTPSYLIEAMEYFRDYAGKDEYGNQVGPMSGGVIIFAAGNESNTISHPSMYEGVIAVASTGPSGKKASYSNYGNWVDISAPGGENGAQPYGDVYSTIPDNQFGQMSGTSMACPHVSGVAALMVSKFGGPGYTNDMLWNKLLESADSAKLYSDELNSKFEGRLGRGALDAFAALYEDDAAVPDVVKSIKTTVN